MNKGRIIERTQSLNKQDEEGMSQYKTMYKAGVRRRKGSFYAASKSGRQATLGVMRKQAQGFVNIEFKSIEAGAFGGTAVNTTGAIALLNGCVAGADIGNRIGRQMELRSIQLQCINSVTASTGVDQVHRVLLVYDRQSNGGAPAFNDVLNGATIVDFRNLANRKRFKILMDKKIQLSASSESGSREVWQYYRKLRHPVQYNGGSAGTIADIQTGSLYIMMIGQEAPGATAGDMKYVTRVRFTDN